MKKIYLQVTSILVIVLFAVVIKASANRDTAVVSVNANTIENIKHAESLQSLIKNKTTAKTALGVSNKGLAVEAYYFPGTSDKKAL